MAGRRSGWLCARRDCPGEPRYQGGQAFPEAAPEEGRLPAPTDDHRSVGLLCRCPASDHAGDRAPVAQRAQQSGRKLASAAAPTRMGHAGFSIFGRPTEVRDHLFSCPQSLRSTLLPTGRQQQAVSRRRAIRFASDTPARAAAEARITAPVRSETGSPDATVPLRVGAPAPAGGR